MRVAAADRAAETEVGLERPAAAPLSGCFRFAPSRSSPRGDWPAGQPCASLARVPEMSRCAACVEGGRSTRGSAASFRRALAASLRPRSPLAAGRIPAVPHVAARPASIAGRTSIDQTCLRHVVALAARRLMHASASFASRAAVVLSPSLCPVTLRPRCRGTGCACKGVFITLARYECFPLAPPSSRSRSFTGRRTQENGGQLPG